MYGTQSYWERTNKKVSKTPPSKFQARAKERNWEKAATTSIFIFQLACIQLPAKGFSCDKKGCKIPKGDMVVYDSFQAAEYEIPVPSSPGAIHLAQVMESQSPSRWACSHRPSCLIATNQFQPWCSGCCFPIPISTPFSSHWLQPGILSCY